MDFNKSGKSLGVQGVKCTAQEVLGMDAVPEPRNGELFGVGLLGQQAVVHGLDIGARWQRREVQDVFETDLKPPQRAQRLDVYSTGGFATAAFLGLVVLRLPMNCWSAYRDEDDDHLNDHLLDKG